MRQKIVFRHYNPNKPHHCGLLLKSLNDARFPRAYKAVRYVAKPKAGDGPYYLNSTIDYIKYLVTEMEADQPIIGTTISTNRPYISTESTNWLLDRGIATVRTLQKGRSGIPSELIDTQNREEFGATCQFEKQKKNIFLTSYTVKTRSKGKTSRRPLQGKTVDDGKENPQTIKFYDFKKDVTDIVDQLNDYYTTRSKSFRCVMVALLYILVTPRVSGKSVWCLENDSDISSTAYHHMTSAGIWQNPWLFHMYNKEVCMAWHPACSRK